MSDGESTPRSDAAERYLIGTEDVWWMFWGILLVTIIERGNIMDENKKWFDLFRVIFELVSAFCGIGLSLGLPSV